MAEALAKQKGINGVEFSSAGTHPTASVNKTALQVLAEEFGVLDTSSLRPKTLSELPAIDVVITMGCGVSCPTLKSSYREDWGLLDPSNDTSVTYKETARLISEKIDNLKKRIETGEFNG